MSYEDDEKQAYCTHCQQIMWFGRMPSGRFACSTCLTYEGGDFPGGEFMRQRSGFADVTPGRPNHSQGIGYGGGASWQTDQYGRGTAPYGAAEKRAECWRCRRETRHVHDGREWKCSICNAAE